MAVKKIEEDAARITTNDFGDLSQETTENNEN